VADGLLVSHIEDGEIPPPAPGAYKIVRPQPVRFVSYPYEWSFSQLQAAALLTLEIQKLALSHGMSLKDASAYNVQFDPAPIFIDTLSFERYSEGKGWVAYRQFCQHFLAPLALMSYRDLRLGQLLRVFIDGAPLDLASELLPATTRLRPSLLAHIHLHAKSQRRYASQPDAAKQRDVSVSRTGLSGLIENLAALTRKLTFPQQSTEWADYYSATNYSSDAAADKERLTKEFLGAASPSTVWDLGANTGRYSRLSADLGAFTIAFDADPAAVDRHYRALSAARDNRILPLVLDLTNPSPGIGWANEERGTLAQRGTADVLLALALIHHLAIGNNVPFAKIAQFFARYGESLIIEFVPKADSQVARMLASRVDVFADYDQASFEEAFRKCFDIVRREPIADSQRVLYLMRRRADV
jgi:ribosomal protein L11 methylase PrmA